MSVLFLDPGPTCQMALNFRLGDREQCIDVSHLIEMSALRDCAPQSSKHYAGPMQGFDKAMWFALRLVYVKNSRPL